MKAPSQNQDTRIREPHCPQFTVRSGMAVGNPAAELRPPGLTADLLELRSVAARVRREASRAQERAGAGDES